MFIKLYLSVGFQSIKVSTNVDNLFVHPSTGDIWFAAIPVRYKLLNYLMNPTENAAPSQVSANTVATNTHTYIVSIRVNIDIALNVNAVNIFN